MVRTLMAAAGLVLWLCLASVEYTLLSLYFGPTVQVLLEVAGHIRMKIADLLTSSALSFLRPVVYAALDETIVVLASLTLATQLLATTLMIGIRTLVRYAVDSQMMALRALGSGLLVFGRYAIGATTPARPLDGDTVRLRLQNISIAQYYVLNGAIKGGVLAIAGNVAFAIVREDIQRDLLICKGFVFIGSFMLIIATYVTWTRGEMFSAGRYNILDYVLPMLMGLAEFGLFLSIAPRTTETWNILVWYAVVSFHALMGVSIIVNRLCQTISADYEDDLQDIAMKYRAWLWRDLKGATALTVASGLVVVLISTGYISAEKAECYLPWLIFGLGFLIVGQALSDLEGATDVLRVQKSQPLL
jgi:hypothetical protein